jgi:hypothetical protein
VTVAGLLTGQTSSMPWVKGSAIGAGPGERPKDDEHIFLDNMSLDQMEDLLGPVRISAASGTLWIYFAQEGVKTMISGKTSIYGCSGILLNCFLRHAQAAFARLGMDACYVPFAVPPDQLEAAVRGIRALNLRGVNVTVPHKQAVMSWLDEFSEEARLIGAVNTIEVLGDRLKGHNTDGRGFLRSLQDDAGSIPRKAGGVHRLEAGAPWDSACWPAPDPSYLWTLIGKIRPGGDIWQKTGRMFSHRRRSAFRW